MLFVFDLDGTLIDSLGDLVIAVNRVLSEHGGRPLARDEVARMVGEGVTVLFTRAFAAAGVTADPAGALPRFLEVYDAILPGTTRPYPGVPEMIAALAPLAPLAVLTNKPTAAARRILDTHGLDASFIGVVGGDGPWRRKPHPEGLLHLVELAGATASDAWMVGDSMVDLRTALAAGTRACIVRWGFGFALFDPALTASATAFVDHPLDLVHLAGRP
jgi:phosphoglycolate phosphatase